MGGAGLVLGGHSSRWRSAPSLFGNRAGGAWAGPPDVRLVRRANRRAAMGLLKGGAQLRARGGHGIVLHDGELQGEHGDRQERHLQRADMLQGAFSMHQLAHGADQPWHVREMVRCHR